MEMMMSWFILPGGLSKTLKNFCLLLFATGHQVKKGHQYAFFFLIMQGGLNKNKFLNRTSLNDIKIEIPSRCKILVGIIIEIHWYT